MASRAAQMLVESDDDNQRGARGGPPAPPNLTASTVDVAPQPNQEPEFQIVEADENLQPIQSPAQQAEPQQTEADQRAAADQGQQDQTETDPQGRTWIRRPKHEQRQRRRDARDRTYAEIEYLRGQVQELSGKVAQYEPRFDEIATTRVQEQIANVDRQIQEAQTKAQTARRRMADAMASQDADAFTLALEDRDEAIIQGQQLAVRKNVLSSGNPLGRESADGTRGAQPAPRQVQPAPQVQPAAPLPRAAAELATDFAETHDWIDMQSKLPDGRIRDRDSRLLAEIDRDVTLDGFNPSTPEYWDELEARGRELLPHRFGAVQPANGNGASNGSAPRAQQPVIPPQRRGPMTAGSADRAPAASPNQVYLNADRKMALIQAGALEPDGRSVADKAKFNRLLRSYQDFDRANGVARQ